MKRFAIVSVVLLLIALLGVGAMYMTSNVTVIAQGVTALEAYRDYDLFTDLSAQVRAGAVVGTSFVAPQELSSAEDYVFYTYTFRLEDNTTLPAEMIEVQITPMSGDILQIGSDQVLTLPAHTIGDVTATILTRHARNPRGEHHLLHLGDSLHYPDDHPDQQLIFPTATRLPVA